MILIKNFYAFILYVSDSGLQSNKNNSYCNTDVECNIRNYYISNNYIIIFGSLAKENNFSVVYFSVTRG
jgi:hypothetical protein